MSTIYHPHTVETAIPTPTLPAQSPSSQAAGRSETPPSSSQYSLASRSSNQEQSQSQRASTLEIFMMPLTGESQYKRHTLPHPSSLEKLEILHSGSRKARDKHNSNYNENGEPGKCDYDNSEYETNLSLLSFPGPVAQDACMIIPQSERERKKKIQVTEPAKQRPKRCDKKPIKIRGRGDKGIATGELALEGRYSFPWK